MNESNMILILISNLLSNVHVYYYKMSSLKDYRNMFSYIRIYIIIIRMCSIRWKTDDCNE
jgi:hypothetical protein